MKTHNTAHTLIQFVLGLLVVCLASACGRSPAASPVVHIISTLPFAPAMPAQEVFVQSSGGGEPRSADYWLIWNTCAEGNQAETTKANGGREAGWVLLDDLLADPGILLGRLDLVTCQQAVNLLQARDLQGVDRHLDGAYALAAQLLAAQLNLAAASEYCPASDEAVGAAQLLLLSLKFDATQGYLGPPLASQDVQTAQVLTEQLANYNTGGLCR